MTLQTPTRSPELAITPARVLRSEWTKMWSLRSTWITLLVAAVLVVGVGIIASNTYGDPAGDSAGPASQDAISVSLAGLTLAQLAIGVLGVLLMAGEYSTGMIRSTMTAVPKRLPVLLAKAGAFGGLTLVVSLMMTFAAFMAARPALRDTAIAAGLGDAGILRSLVGASFYLVVVGVMGVALGALVRSAAAGIGILVAMLLIVPGLISLLPASVSDAITPYLPTEAGSAVMSLHGNADILGIGGGAAVLVAYMVVFLGGAAYRLMKFDV